MLGALLALLGCGARAAGADPPRHDFPRVGEYEVLSCDFHMHTMNSDGTVTTRDRVLGSFNCGYDAIAVTDHGTARAYRVAAYVGESLGLIVIRGLETGISGGEHLVVLNVSADYQPRNPHGWASKPGAESVFYQDQMREIANAGGLIIYAHPHKGFTHAVDWGIKEGIIRGIEVKNGVVGTGLSTVESHGTHCYPFAFDWALEQNLAVFANTDSHDPRSGRGPVTLVLAEDRSPNGVMEAIRKRRTIAWFDGMLWGRKELLSRLVKSTVDVRRTSEGRLIAENRGPVALKVALEGNGGGFVELAPYKETGSGENAGTDRISVKWKNVWTGTKQNLRSTFDLSPR